jgi:hypothetical protein
LSRNDNGNDESNQEQFVSLIGLSKKSEIMAVLEMITL